MLIVNFAHSLTDAQINAVEQSTGRKVERIKEINAHCDLARPLALQVKVLVDSINFSPAQWQSLPLLIVLPSHNAIAAILLAELHGRMGYFPAILRLRPVETAVPPQFEVAEIINLQAARERARQTR
jgi:hypothetical protein